MEIGGAALPPVALLDSYQAQRKAHAAKPPLTFRFNHTFVMALAPITLLIASTTFMDWKHFRPPPGQLMVGETAWTGLRCSHLFTLPLPALPSLQAARHPQWHGRRSTAGLPRGYSAA